MIVLGVQIATIAGSQRQGRPCGCWPPHSRRQRHRRASALRLQFRQLRAVCHSASVSNHHQTIVQKRQHMHGGATFNVHCDR